MKTIKSLIIISLLWISLSAVAFDGLGHRVVAVIAYQNLTDKARSQVDAVLGKRGIIYESTWADEIRSDKKYDYSHVWHYQNLRDSLTVQDLGELLAGPAAEGEHLFYAIDLMKSRLKKNKSDAEALKFLVHFVGDLHQPMHLGRKEDLGGNKVDTKWFGKSVNLHALWDRELPESQKYSYSEYSQYLQDKFEPRKAQFLNYTMLQSVAAGYAIRSAIYAYDTSDSNSFHYLYRFTDPLDEMLYRGGIQLANMLNSIYQ